MRTNSTIIVDEARGVDVFKGTTRLLHAEGPRCYEIAKRFAAEKPGRWVRYWAKKA